VRHIEIVKMANGWIVFTGAAQDRHLPAPHSTHTYVAANRIDLATLVLMLAEREDLK